MAYQRNPIKNAPEVPYHGELIEPRNKMHWQQQIHKYNLGLFVTGIIAMATALLTIIFDALIIAKGGEGDATKGFAAAASTTTIIFVITLAIDIVLTVCLNKYYKNKFPLILFIPALALMLIFAVPELMSLLTLFGIKVSVKGLTGPWTAYVVMSICGAFIIFELWRMILHRDDLDIYKEVKKALR